MTTPMTAASQVNARLDNIDQRAPANASLVKVTPPRLLPKRASGWDPYEVWRTRIKRVPNTSRSGHN